MSLQDLEQLEILILREVAHRDGARAAQIAAAIGEDSAGVRTACERLEAEGMLRRFAGFRVTTLARTTYGSALWCCERCGCVDEDACCTSTPDGRCSWVRQDLCSACATAPTLRDELASAAARP